MGFLQNTSGAIGSEFSKAVVSFWFRVPQKSHIAAMADYSRRHDEWYWSNDQLIMDSTMCTGYSGPCVPLLAWGPIGEELDYRAEDHTLWLGYKYGPSFIGVTASDDEANYPSCLTIRLQSLNSVDGYYQEFGVVWTFPNYFIAAGIDAGGTMPTPPDQWHHALISWDITGEQGSMWVAVDDVNYTNLGPYSLAGNQIESVGQAAVNADWGPERYWVSHGFTWETGNFGVPVPEEFLKYNYEVEMAELQIFTGVTLDTGIENNRRAFVTNDGKPVLPKYSRDQNGTLTADPSSAPVNLLGKLPSVALCQSSGNWVSGKNLGTAFETLAKTGTIKPFTPDPELGK